MKFRLRTILIVIAVVSVLLALPTFIYTSVMPANRRINERLSQAIGKQFEDTGVLPKSPYLNLNDFPDLIDLRLDQLGNGDLYNRWGELIDISPVGIGEFDGKKAMSCLLYTSPSPRDLSTSRMPSSA